MMAAMAAMPAIIIMPCTRPMAAPAASPAGAVPRASKSANRTAPNSRLMAPSVMAEAKLPARVMASANSGR